MKLTFLGSGSAFSKSVHNFQSNMVLESQNRQHLLIDCGADIRHSLPPVGLSYKDIQAVYVSHLHSDHVGGLEWLAFSSFFDPSCERPSLFVHPKLITLLWRKVLSGGLQSIEGNESATLQTFFNVPPLQKGDRFVWESAQFQLVKSIHVYDGKKLLPSYGLFFQVKDIHIFITTDTQFKPDYYMPYYEKADLIFHDCETSKRISGVHARFEDLITLSKEIKSKMWLYHYSDESLSALKSEGFKGFVQRGQTFFLKRGEI